MQSQAPLTEVLPKKVPLPLPWQTHTPRPPKSEKDQRVPEGAHNGRGSESHAQEERLWRPGR